MDPEAELLTLRSAVAGQVFGLQDLESVPLHHFTYLIKPSSTENISAQYQYLAIERNWSICRRQKLRITHHRSDIVDHLQSRIEEIRDSTLDLRFTFSSTNTQLKNKTSMANRLGVMAPSSTTMSSSTQSAKGSSPAARPTPDGNVIKRYIHLPKSRIYSILRPY